MLRFISHSRGRARRRESRPGLGRRLRLGLWRLREWLGLAERGDDGWGMGIGDGGAVGAEEVRPAAGRRGVSRVPGDERGRGVREGGLGGEERGRGVREGGLGGELRSEVCG